MMWGYSYGPMLLWMSLWGILGLVVVGVVICALAHAVGGAKPTNEQFSDPSALEVLRQRYARGEIDAVTFEQMRERLVASGAQDVGIRDRTKSPRRRGGALWLLVVTLLVAALLVGGLGAALAWGPNGMNGMMGGYGPGWMMGGYQQGPSPQGTPEVGVTQVTIQNFAYQPAIIQVPAGTTVTWTNQDSVAHTVTFRNGMKDSGLFQQGQTFSYTFASPGTYDYYCAVHPYMVGRVIVTS